MNTELDHQRHLLVIDDKKFLSGESVLSFFKILLKSKPYKYVILNDVTAIREEYINDPRYPPDKWDKMQHVHDSIDGSSIKCSLLKGKSDERVSWI